MGENADGGRARNEPGVRRDDAREDIVRALGDLAAKPLQEPAAERMRRVLAHASPSSVRAALRRLSADLVESPRLSLVGVPCVVDGFRGGRGRSPGWSSAPGPVAG